MKQDDRAGTRPEAYPKKTETDTQIERQDEYIDPESNSKDDQTSMSGDTQQEKATGSADKRATDRK